MARKVKHVKHHVKKTKTTPRRRSSGAGRKSTGGMKSILGGW